MGAGPLATGMACGLVALVTGCGGARPRTAPSVVADPDARASTVTVGTEQAPVAEASPAAPPVVEAAPMTLASIVAADPDALVHVLRGGERMVLWDVDLPGGASTSRASFFVADGGAWRHVGDVDSRSSHRGLRLVRITPDGIAMLEDFDGDHEPSTRVFALAIAGDRVVWADTGDGEASYDGGAAVPEILVCHHDDAGDDRDEAACPSARWDVRRAARDLVAIEVPLNGVAAKAAPRARRAPPLIVTIEPAPAAPARQLLESHATPATVDAIRAIDPRADVRALRAGEQIVLWNPDLARSYADALGDRPPGRASFFVAEGSGWRHVEDVEAGPATFSLHIATVTRDGIAILTQSYSGNGEPPERVLALALHDGHVVAADSREVSFVEERQRGATLEIQVERRLDPVSYFHDGPRTVARWDVRRTADGLVATETSLTPWIDALAAFCTGAHPELASAAVLAQIDRCDAVAGAPTLHRTARSVVATLASGCRLILERRRAGWRVVGAGGCGAPEW